MANRSQEFYDDAYQNTDYPSPIDPKDHAFYLPLSTFLKRYQLANCRCLEVGTGRGAFQGLVADYYGIDIAFSAGIYISFPFAVASATGLPFSSDSFDGVWSITVLEHVPQPESALEEMWRVLKPGGYLYLAPAWQCRPWAANGYQVRPYSDFSVRDKLIKASIPIRNSVAFRSLSIFPRRLHQALMYKRNRQPTQFRYRELEPNYECFWQSDSDAVNSMDPFQAYLWYVSRGARCLSYTSLKSALMGRNGPLIFQKPREGSLVDS
ncbi:MAG: hypothetical protein BMS9Abin02_1498 [Anaerolineae bacterium]|nr:MAG: hypothetical protein BMS9Abin02_1498 [Anaerolineae bacterium]